MDSKTRSIGTRAPKSKKTFWEHHLDNWQKSGLSQVQYCQQNQLNKHTFAYWKAKLEKKPVLPPLLPVTVQPDTKQDFPFLHSGIVLSFNERLSIQLENGFNSDTLSRLIDLLERL